jgi:hypothetical protein
MLGSLRASARAAVGVLVSGALAVTVGVVCAAEDKNSAFLFIKPHANTAAAQALVKRTLLEKGLVVTQEGELTAAQIDKGMLIDNHYYAIASKATLLKPEQMPVPADKFEKGMGLPWAQVLKEGSAYNALDACAYLGVDAVALDALWAGCKKVKLGGGFYCGLISVPGKKPIYVFNGELRRARAHCLCTHAPHWQ